MYSRPDTKLEIDHYIVWKDNVGYLPGSLLKFKRGQDGELCLLDEENIETFRKKQKLIKDHIFPPLDQVDYEVSICSRCLKSDSKENLVKNNKYCKECAQIDSHLFKLYKNLSSQNVLNMDHETEKTTLRKQRLSSDFEFLNQFEWDKYLSKYNLEAIPIKSFLPEQNYPTVRNKFEVGMKLEGIDPSHPSKFCVLTIVDIQGFRLRLHFDGYSSRFDFWINADSKFIFPVGFCKKTNRKLEHPHGITSFNWKNYLSSTNSKPAPEDLFSFFKVNSSTSNEVVDGFYINSKLEAVDIANSALICVATIKDTLNDQILIHFDGWDDSFDYWTPVTSPLIHPINWCKSKGKYLTPPKDYKKEFVWEEYLKETDSKPVPESAFNMTVKNRSKSLFNLWKPGMRLEAVDKRNPHLIRVASIVNRTLYSVRVHFDGWDEKYDCVFEEDSPDLHPINWCLKTNHKLEPPPNKYYAKLNTLCPIPCCNGYGHIKWYKYKTHTQEKDCPYSKANYLEKAFSENLDRYENSDSTVSDNEHENNDLNCQFYSEMSENEEKLQEKINPYYLKLIKENYLDMKKSLKSNNSHTLRYVMEYVKSFNFKPVDIVDFDCLKMEEIIRKLTDDNETATIFKQEKIDGISFLCLKHEDITGKLKIKLNSAVKIIPYIFVNLKFIFKDGF